MIYKIKFKVDMTITVITLNKQQVAALTTAKKISP